MTEKRFKRFCIADGFKIVAIRDNGEIMNSKQVCNKLNELYEENEQSKMMIATLRNMVLEQEDLEKENQYIKNTIKDMLNNERTQLGKSVLKQLIEAIQ